MHHMDNKKSLLPAWLLLFVGFALSIALGLQQKKAIDEVAAHNFSRVCEQITLKIEERLNAYSLVLRAGSGVFAGSDAVTRKEWQKFVAQMGPEKAFPGVTGVGFAMVIPPDQLATHTHSVRAEGFPGYRVWPAGERALYTSIIYLEPFAGRNLHAFGYDMYTEPVRRAAMEQARDTNDVSLSGKVELVQETGTEVQAGVLMYFPVYRHGMPIETAAQRQAALMGWVYSPYRMDDLMQGMLEGWRDELGNTVHLNIYDGNRADPGHRLYQAQKAHVNDPRTTLFEEERIDFGGRHWLLVFDQHKEFIAANYARAWQMLILGMVASLFLFLLVRANIRTRARAVSLAQELTEDVLQKEAVLRQSQAELEEAQRIAKVGNWTWDTATDRVTWSAALYHIFGMDPDVPPPDYTAQSALFTPASWDRLNASILHTKESGIPYALDLEIVRADGTHGWTLSQGEAIRDAGGKVVGLRGTAADVTDRMQASIRIDRLTSLYKTLSECNSAIVHCQTQEELFARICEVVVRYGGMKMAWIGLVDAAGNVLPVASYGIGTEYLDGIEITVHADDPHGRGAVGTAIRENQLVWGEDFQNNPVLAPWHERGVRFGWKAAAALPICRHGKPFGALTFYVATHGWFDEETRRLLEEMAGDINFALDKMGAEAETQAAQAGLLESEARYRLLVEQSIAGAFIIQDGKFVYANPRMVQILGYSSGDELIGVPPADVVALKDREYAASILQKQAQGELNTVKLMLTLLRKDGTTTDVGINSLVTVYQSHPAFIGLLQDISDKQVAEDQIRRYTEQLEHTFIQTVGLATNLVEMRDPYTAGHEQRVAEISVAIGKEMGLTEDQLEGLRVGGHLHDVGKITVPAEILVKPSRLTANEYAIMKEHPQAGYDVLKGVDFPWPVALIAFQHHERMDGSGYPQGLKGDAIILEARITAVADVVESMASHRPYRAGLGIDAALAEIERGSGTAYDPKVVDICLRLFREKGYVIPG